MEFKRIKCPHCGKEVPVPPDTESLMCIFCFNSIEIGGKTISDKSSEDGAKNGRIYSGDALPQVSLTPSDETKEETLTAVPSWPSNVQSSASLQQSADNVGKRAETKNETPLHIVAKIVCVALSIIVFNTMNHKGDNSRNATNTSQTTFNLGIPQPKENSGTSFSENDVRAQSSAKKNNSASTRSVQMPSQTSSLHVSLGGICIGYNKNEVYSVLGKERAITDPSKSGHLRYQYPNMEVVITNGIVTGFISKNASVQTERGIHEGSTLQEVVRAYGKDYSKLDFEGSTLYEYKMKSVNGKDCLQRFAIKNGRVDYVSCRVLDK